MSAKRWAVLAVTVPLLIPANAYAEGFPYKFIMRFYTEMQACNRMGLSPLTPDVMRRLKAKIDDLARIRNYDSDTVQVVEQRSIDGVNRALADGSLDGARCHERGKWLIEVLNDPAFWKE